MRILVIEDNQDIAANLGDYLEDRGHTVDFAADGVTGLHLAVVHDFDAIVLDLSLPGLDGLEVCRKLRNEARKQTPVLMLTARDSLDNKLAGFDSGADDYLIKPFALPELEARVRVLLRRSQQGEAAPERDVRLGRLRLSGNDRRMFVDGKPLELSPREFAVLELLLQRQGRVVSKAQLQDHLATFAHPAGEGGDTVGDTAIEVYVHRVRKKLEEADVEIVTVRGFGYLLQIRGGH